MPKCHSKKPTARDIATVRPPFYNTSCFFALCCQVSVAFVFAFQLLSALVLGPTTNARASLTTASHPPPIPPGKLQANADSAGAGRPTVTTLLLLFLLCFVLSSAGGFCFCLPTFECVGARPTSSKPQQHSPPPQTLHQRQKQARQIAYPLTSQNPQSLQFLQSNFYTHPLLQACSATRLH